MTTLKPGADPAVVNDLMKVLHCYEIQTKKGRGWEVLGFVLHLDTWWISKKKATVGGRKEACDWPAKDSWISDIEDWTRDVGQLCSNEAIVRTCLYEVNHNKFHWTLLLIFDRSVDSNSKLFWFSLMYFFPRYANSRELIGSRKWLHILWLARVVTGKLAHFYHILNKLEIYPSSSPVALYHWTNVDFVWKDRMWKIIVSCF